MFESRNLLFQHLRDEQHAIVSDDDGGLEVNDVSREAASHPSDEAGGSRNTSPKKTPGAQATSSRIKPKDLEWRDIGSGTVVKTFKNVTRLHTTTRHGPPIEDVHIRRIWSLGKGILIDECEVDRPADHVLNRELWEPDAIRVELVLKGAQSLYMRPRLGVAEIYIPIQGYVRKPQLSNLMA